MGKTPGSSKPTFVFPASLEEVIRRIVPGNLVEAPDPTQDRVRIADTSYSPYSYVLVFQFISFSSIL